MPALLLLVLLAVGTATAGGVGLVTWLVVRTQEHGLHAHADGTVHVHVLGWRRHGHGGGVDRLGRLAAAVALLPLTSAQRGHAAEPPRRPAR